MAGMLDRRNPFSNQAEAVMWLRILVTMAVGAVIACSGAVAQGNSPNRSQSAAEAVQYLDHLRSCTAYTYKYPVPLARSIAENTILGKNGDACKVSFHVPNCCMANCAFSAATIKALTSQAKYRKARTGKFDASLSEAQGKNGRECHWVYFPAPASNPSPVRKP